MKITEISYIHVREQSWRDPDVAKHAFTSVTSGTTRIAKYSRRTILKRLQRVRRITNRSSKNMSVTIIASTLIREKRRGKVGKVPVAILITSMVAHRIARLAIQCVNEEQDPIIKYLNIQ